MPIDKKPSEFFIFSVKVAQTSSTIIFVSAGPIRLDRLKSELKKFLDENIPPDQFVLLGPASIEDELLTISKDKGLRSWLPSHTRHTATPPILPIKFGADGVLSRLDSGKKSASAPDFRQKLIDVGLRQIFFSREGLLRASPGFHYVLPSDNHADRFIRTGNVLIAGPEINFIAFALLPFIRAGLKRIYTDTASISSVAYALVLMRRQLDPEFELPTITSFSSYRGMKTMWFEDKQDSLCIISASTSGTMDLGIVSAQNIPKSNVVTLFYGGARPIHDSQVLCDLTKRLEGAKHIEKISSYPPEDCPHCNEDSVAITLSGDQFLLANLNVEEALITDSDAPDWFKNTLPSLVGTGAVRVQFDKSGSTGRTRQVYLHLRALLQHFHNKSGRAELLNKLEDIFVSSVPARLTAIIYLDDESSRDMADLAGAIFQEATGKTLDPSRVLTAVEVKTDPGKIVLPDSGTILIVASTVVTGRSLLSISQALRQIAPNAQQIYLIGVARMVSEDTWKELQSNLGYGKYPQQHRIQVGQVIYVPDGCAGTNSTPWYDERLFHQRSLKSQEFSDMDASLREFLEARVEWLGNAESKQVIGMQEQLFLPRVNKGLSFEQLQLRPGFVFWKFFDWKSRNFSQADVFFTISAILHKLRERNPRKWLCQNEHVRTLLSPGCFGRFNDGVIQASLLRAASHHELDYSQDETKSSRMKEILVLILTNFAQETGEAASEFLLALAQGKLRLSLSHSEDVSERLKSLQLPPLLGLLLKRWDKIKADGAKA
jgi:hypothetical protein